MLTFDKIWESDGTAPQILVIRDASLDHFQMTLQVWLAQYTTELSHH